MKLHKSGRSTTFTGMPANREAAGLDGGTIATLLTDPQTSGGLLAGVAQDRTADCLAALRAAGLDAAIVGYVTEAGGLRLG